jgi:hypothetical protein
MVCYKDAGEDRRINHVENDRVTVEWHKAPVNRPENALTGVGTLHGAHCSGTVNFSAMDAKSYQVRFAGHWVFEGTGLADGENFGQGERIVGYETDAAHFEWVNGFPMNWLRVCGTAEASRIDQGVWQQHHMRAVRSEKWWDSVVA